MNENDLRNAASSIKELLQSPIAELAFIVYLLVFAYFAVGYINNWWPYNRRRKRT